MNKKVIVTFPICIKELFFDNMEIIKKVKKEEIPGFEMVSIKIAQNNLEIKIPCHIQGLKYKKQPYFVFLLPKKSFGKETKINPKNFFEKGLCRIEGVNNFNNCTIITFSGEYNEDSSCLKGILNYYYPPHFGW